MKRIAIALAALWASAGFVAADPIEGIWQTQVDEGAFAHVEILPCGPAFCGKILRSYRGEAQVDSPNVGKTLVIDMVPQGDGAYEGKVWRPSNGKIYLGKIALEQDRMQLRGCVAGGLVCSRQTWSRVQ